MKTALCLTLFVGLYLTGCGKENGAGKPPASPTNPPASTVGENPLNAPADYLGVLGKAQKSAVKVVDVASLTKAVEMFQASEGRLPKDLDEVVKQGYIPRIPDAPSGMKITYDAATGKVRVVKQ
jgi:hypothetical protein